ncbi:MAG: hypothetical protein RIG63_11150 [Coleofasciculus chthonoplastes F3-SA18-01]|jgi:hypothetical protein|uniref:CIS tube protein n=1 Tax=Coleofasciculus TaxID=669368 RepID=UPI003305148A
MLKNLFKLEKLKIYVYKDKKQIGVPQDTFEVMFNPESYSLKYENKYQEHQGMNTSGSSLKYALSKPTHLSLTLILDGTGVTPGGRKDVYKEVNRFLTLTTHMDGETHEPKSLKIEWGDLIFNCRLGSVDIKYTLFNRSGQPLRAELQTEFSGDIEDSKRVKQENKNSPDLTHKRIIKAGDNLPLMANQIYGDPAYYIQLAAANNLNNFRKLNVGTSISLPPTTK